jgi:AcrR family transcriptional regulator
MVQKRKNTLVRQRQIIDAARKVIIKYGSEHVTVRRIAKEVGISEAAVYRHFKSKRDILSLLADHIEENLVGDITRASTSGHTPLENLDNVLISHLSAIEQRRGISFQVIAEIISLGDKKLNRKVSDTINKYISLLKDILLQGVKSGEVRDDIDLEGAATLLFGMMQGLVNIWALGNYSFALEEKYVSLWNTFRQAVIKR